MTKQEFQKYIQSKYRFELVSSYFFCIVFILLSLVLPFTMSRKLSFWPLSLFLVTLGIAGLKMLRAMYTPSTISNKLTKDENKEKIKALAELYTGKIIGPRGSIIIFIHRRSWWQPAYAVSLNADHGMIGVSALSGNGVRGDFIDFGASKRLEKEILNNIF